MDSSSEGYSSADPSRSYGDRSIMAAVMDQQQRYEGMLQQLQEAQAHQIAAHAALKALQKDKAELTDNFEKVKYVFDPKTWKDGVRRCVYGGSSC